MLQLSQQIIPNEFLTSGGNKTFLLQNLDNRFCTSLQVSLELSGQNVQVETSGCFSFSENEYANPILIAQFEDRISGEIRFTSRDKVFEKRIPTIVISDISKPSLENETWVSLEPRNGCNENKEAVLAFENSKFADFSPYFKNSKKSRLFDRAVIESQTYDAFSLADILCKKMGLKMNPNQAGPIDTPHPCRWNHAAPANQVDRHQGVLSVDASLIEDHSFSTVFSESLSELHELQFGSSVS